MKQLLFEIYNGDALSQAIQQIEEYMASHTVKSLVFHMYCGIDDRNWIMHIRNELVERFPLAEVCGVTSHAEIINGSLTDPVTLLSAMFFELTDVRVYYFPDILDHEAEFGEKARRIIDDTPDIKAAELLVKGAPVDNLAFLEAVSKCQKDVKIFGG